VQRLIGAIREATERRTLWREADETVQTINRKLLGWANYFSLGPTGKAYRVIDQYTPRRLRRWLCKKHKVRNYAPVVSHDSMSSPRSVRDTRRVVR
jgi:hypothetical protein